jgi:5-methylcytosine-specific restriction protein A
MKLGNYAALDPSVPGSGLPHGGRREAEIWDTYHRNPAELRRLAEALRAGVTGTVKFPVVPEEDEDDVEEGRLLFRQHRVRERSRALVHRKKAQVLQQTGQLACEACGFDFEKAYGPLGKGFIECHHTVPLSLAEISTTRLQDLALLCSNCHRILHYRRPWPTIAELRAVISSA